MDDTTVERASAEALIDLRWRVLRYGRPRETAHMPGDDAPETRHWVIREADDVVACVTVMPVPFPTADAEPHMQLRGMAVAAHCQGRGYGGALLRAVHADVGEPMWCNARTHAIGFYARHGWESVGSVFDIEEVGPHRIMRWYPEPDAAESLGRGRFLELIRRHGWEWVRRHAAEAVVAVLPITDRDEVVLVEQHRPPIGTSAISRRSIDRCISSSARSTTSPSRRLGSGSKTRSQ